MPYIFAQKAIDGSIYVPLRNSSGAPVTALAFNSAGAVCRYVRPRGSSVAITLASLASPTAAHTDGGFVEVDATNMPGLYRLDLPDAALESGESFVIVQIGFTSTFPTCVHVNLDPHPSIVSGEVVDDAANSSSTFKTDLTETATDAYKSAFLLWRSGALAGEVQKISAFNPTTDFLTVGTAFTAEPAAGDEFVIVNR